AEADGFAEFFLSRRVVPGEKELSAERYMAAQRHIEQMPQYSIARGERRTFSTTPAPAIGGKAWSALGPGNVGGRTRSLLVNPKNPLIMYAGAVTGGVWK